MQKSERWGGMGLVGGGNGNPSARLRAARSMPQWMESRGGLPTPPAPPPPPPDPDPLDNDPEYEMIDVPIQNYSNTPITTIEVRVKRCELCGASGPSVLCEQCPQQSFCPSCDEMYHRHPKRQSHMRRAIIDNTRHGEPPRPPLPPKGEGLMSPAPVPPPRKNKKNLLPPGSSNTLGKRDTGIVGSIKRMITGKSVPPPRPLALSRDRSGSLLNNNIDFQRNQMMMGEMETNGWSRGRVGSMTALNMAPAFGHMMHAQSMAHMGCPGCWGWGSQAALHQAGMHGPHGMGGPHGVPPPHAMQGPHGMHGMMPPPQPYWYPSWDPRKQRHHHHGRTPADSSSEDDDRPSPALSRRSNRPIDSDSDESFKKSRPQSRRDSFADLRRRDDDIRSLRGGRYDDDTRSLRGERRDSLRRRDELQQERSGRRNRRFDDTMSERGGRRADDLISERGGLRRRQDDFLNEERLLRRKDDDIFSDRGGRRNSESKFRDDSWDRSFRRPERNDSKYNRENSLDRSLDKKNERFVVDSDSDRKLKSVLDKKQERLQDHFKNKDDKKSGLSSTKSSETVSSILSSTSGDEKGRWLKKDRVFSDTGQKRRATLENKINEVLKPKEELLEKKSLSDKKEEEEDMKPLGPIPKSEWECQHCTYVNRPGSRVCEVCCKTRTMNSEIDGTEKIEEKEDINIGTEEVQLKIKEETKNEIKEEPAVTETKPEEQPKKKEPLTMATIEAQPAKNVSQTSKGTSPPPQSISTQTYDVAGLGLKKTSSEVGWTSPRRSFSRQSIVSETAQSGISPPRSRSPAETDSQVTESKPSRRNEISSSFARKASRASSLVNEHQPSSMVQKQVNQGLEMVKLLREAEDVGFSGEEVSVAVEHCGDASPLQWLLDNWTHMIDTVVTLATNYGHERKENTIGTVSEREARAALIQHQGSVWSAVTEVVQQRQNKYGELLSRGNFSREDIVTALTAHHGDLEAAYTELTKGQLKPFLRRMWAPTNQIVEQEDQKKIEWDASGRVQSWLTQHVYQSLPKPKNTGKTEQLHRRHSDVHRFLNEVLSGQTNQGIVDNRYASLHSLAGKNGKVFVGSEFGAPPERYTSCLNLHEASTRMDMTPRLYNSTNQSRPSYLTKTYDDSRSLKLTERQISVPDHLQEFKEKIIFDRQLSAPEENLLKRLDPSIIQQVSKWKSSELNTELAQFLQIDSQTDDKSEYLEDSKSEDALKDDAEDENAAEVRDQVYNGRLQLMIQRNHKRKRRAKRSLKSYHSKFNVKSEAKQLRNLREESSIKNKQKVFKEEETRNGIKSDAMSGNRIKKDSTDEYESIESSEDDMMNNKMMFQTSDMHSKKSSKNERIIVIHRESSDDDKKQKIVTKKMNNQSQKTQKAEPIQVMQILDTPSDKDSISKSHSEDIHEGDYKELDESFTNSIPFIDEDEQFSDASEDIQENNVINTPPMSLIKTSENSGQSLSEDSNKYKPQLQNSPTIKINVNNKNKLQPKKEIQNNTEIKENRRNSNNKNGVKTIQVEAKKMGQTTNQVKETDLVKKRTEEFSQDQLNEQIEEESEDEEYEYVEVKQETLDNMQVNLTVLPETVSEYEKNIDTTNTKANSNKTITSEVKDSNLTTKKEDKDSDGSRVEKTKDTNPSNNKVDKILKNTEKENQGTGSMETLTKRNENNKENLEEAKSDIINKPEIVFTEIQHGSGASNNDVNGSHNIIMNNTEDLEKKNDDELSKKRVDSHSVDINADNSILTALVPGNLKTKVQVDVNRLSPVVDADESSDKDVSPIPTDSEGDKLRSLMNSNVDTKEENKQLSNKHEEMVTLIKESLSKDVVLDRLVGTILGVLQGSGSTNNLKEQELTSLFRKEEILNVKEITVGDGDEGMVTALQLVKDINVNPKDALQETILQCDNIKKPKEIIKDEIQIKNEEFQREVRKVLAEGLVTTYPQAELVVNLMEMKFTAEEAVQAAAECTTLQAAISFLHQECPLCANKCTINQMIGLLECDHRCCKECAFNYFNLQITEGSVLDCVCPFCRKPNLKACSQDQGQLYFSHLDILLKGILSEATHELFQRKLRDWTLAQDPNFKWCTKCSSGFIANPHQKVLMCPDCRFITCAKCRQPWEGGHEASCEELAEQIEPENLLNKHLEEEGITCPSCKARYTLARGGCMHMTCTGCKHEFCSGCSKPFLMGDNCQVSEYCVKLGLHAHHPRNCLFYLRDKEPQALEQLLKDNGVEFKREETETNKTGRCKVSILKETDDGMIETECNYPIHAQALCRRHYVERLSRFVRRVRLETLNFLGWEDLETVVRRHGLTLPPNPYGTPVEVYTDTLRKIVQEQIPLE